MRYNTTWILIGAILAFAVASGGCSTTAAKGPAGEDAAADAAAAVDLGGARAWKENCVRCHNYRRPRERSDDEWRIIVHHMRVRANFTAREAEAILRFLQAAN